MLQIADLSEERIVSSALSFCECAGEFTTFFSIRDVQRQIFQEEGYSVKSSEWKDAQRIIPGNRVSAALRASPAFVVLDGVGRRNAKYSLRSEAE